MFSPKTTPSPALTTSINPKMDSIRRRLSRSKANTVAFKAFPPREPLTDRISRRLNTAITSLIGTDLNLPDRIRPPGLLSTDTTIIGQTSYSMEAFQKSRDKYVIWTRLPDGEYAADWNGGNVPTEDDVRRMLAWYSIYRVYDFPDVDHVSLMSRGRTNYFFLVEFVPNSRPGKLPQKVVLRFSLPVCPHEKLESEVATMVWAAQVSPQVIPKVLLFDSYPQNSLGLEWMMIEPVVGFSFQEYMLQGSTDTGLEGFAFLSETPPLSDTEYINVGKELHDFMAKIKITASGVPKDNTLIGSLRIDWETKKFFTGPVISPHFYSADRLWRKPHFGPYSSVESYLNDYVSIWKDEYKDDQWVQRGLDDLDIVIERMSKRLVALPSEKWSLPTNGGRMNGWPVTISHPDPRPDNILADGDGKLIAIMGWENATLMPIPLRTALTKLDQVFQLFGCEFIIDPMQVDLEYALPPKKELLDRIWSCDWRGKDASIILEPVMECKSGREAAFRALMEVCEKLPLRRDGERRWLDDAVLAMMDQHGKNLEQM